MAKLVGLSRNIKMQWLNKTVELLTQNLSNSEIKEQLNEYLAFEIKSETNLRKTREILMNIWVYENLHSEKIKIQALNLIQSYPEYSLHIHWCMMLAAYPVFADMCKLLGKMLEFQEIIVLSQMKQKLFDEWGERTTLYHSIDKLIATLKNLGVMVCEKPGKYQISTYKVTNEKVVNFMIYVIMITDDAGYYTLTDLASANQLFPFDYKIKKDQFFDDERFALNNFGGELSISAK